MKNRNQLLALLLAIVMTLGLCACGGSVAAQTDEAGAEAQAETQESAPAEEEPEPEKTYVSKSMELVVSRQDDALYDYYLTRFCGPLLPSLNRITTYAYDEYGVPTETVTLIDDEAQEFLDAVEWAEYDPDKYVIETDDTGTLTSVTKPGDSLSAMMGGSAPVIETAVFEDGRVTRIDRFKNENGEKTDKIEEVVYQYDGSGKPVSKTTTSWYTSGFYSIWEWEEPLVTIIEYNGDGACIRYRSEDLNEDYDALEVKEYSWEFDAAGNPVSLTLKEILSQDIKPPLQDVELELTRTAVMEYDAEGRMIAAEKTEGEVTTSYTYTYDEDGRLAACVRKTGDIENTSVYEYGEEGYLIADRRSADGDVLYTWEQEEDGDLVGTVKSDNKKIHVFPDTSLDPDLTIYSGRNTDSGKPLYEHVYRLLPSALTLEPVYVGLNSDYKYETMGILVEVDPEQLALAETARNALSAYYPVLSESYCGVPAPAPNGSERLVRIESQRWSELKVVADVLYDDDGTLTEIRDAFDPVGSYEYPNIQKADEQGRLIEYSPYSDSPGNKFLYSYGEDPDTYTLTRIFDGNANETELSIEEEKISAWISLPLEEVHTENYVRELNEDGLISLLEMHSADGTVYTYRYSFEVETYEDGSIKTVNRIDDDGYSLPLMEFDRSGYLTMYRGSDSSQEVIYYYE